MNIPHFRHILSLALVSLILTIGASAEAAVTLEDRLLGGDITDPYNLIDVSGYTNFNTATWRQQYSSATWINIQSAGDSPFSDIEGPVSLFNNVISGGGKSKWYDGSFIPSDTNPAYVELEFAAPFVLTHFTLATANDNSPHNRTPTNWQVLGSNDGVNWTSIYTYDYTTTGTTFTTTNDTNVLFSSFTTGDGGTISSSVLNAAQQSAVQTSLGSTVVSTPDFTTPEAYSHYRLQITGTQGQATQLGEWELFGNTTETITPKVMTNGDGTLRNLLTATNASYHLDASNSDSLTTDADGNVSVWADSVGNNNFTQPNVANQPNLGTITINGNEFAAVDFTIQSGVDRGGDYMVGSTSTSARTVAALVQLDSESGNLAGLWGNSGADLGIRYNETNNVWQGTGTGGNTGDFANNGSYTWNGGDTSIPATDVHLITAFAGANTALTATIGSYFVNSSYPSRPMDGRIAELIVFDSALNDHQQQLLNTYFYLKYGMETANRLQDASGVDIDLGWTPNSEVFTVGNYADHGITLHNYGVGGFGIAGNVPADGGSVKAAFDLGLTPGFMPTGSELIVVSNTDEAFGYTKEQVVGLDGTTQDAWLWDKEWKITNLSAEGTEGSVVFGFDSEDALYDYAFSGDTLWALMFKENAEDTFEQISDFALFDGTSLQFMLDMGDIQTGFYTIGADRVPEVPEPASWFLLLCGVGFVAFRGVKRRRQSLA
ncbi:MAG: discoidin domain-containing protein [Planctomycetia bacterium]|nr:discoidin domain-containing protein [Planctomycetia bacterium]